MDAGDRAVLVGRREGGLDLARHQLRGGVAHEVAHVGAGVRGGVEQLALADAGPRVAGHVAHGVAAALAARTGPSRRACGSSAAASRSGMWWSWMFWRVVMWPLLSGRVLLDHVGERLHLLRRDAAQGQLHADHLDVGLALAVDALLQAEADELVLGRVAAEELLGLVVEVVELALEDRDDVPRDVLADLGVLERALAALALRAVRRRVPCRRKVPKAGRVSEDRSWLSGQLGSSPYGAASRRHRPGRPRPLRGGVAAGARGGRHRADRGAQRRAERGDPPALRGGARDRSGRRPVQGRAVRDEGPGLPTRPAPPPRGHALPARRRSPRRGGLVARLALPRGRASCSSARPTRPSWGSCRPPSPTRTGRRATPGTRTTRRAGRAAARARGGVRDGVDRARQRRRRLDPHPGLAAAAWSA